LVALGAPPDVVAEPVGGAARDDPPGAPGPRRPPESVAGRPRWVWAVALALLGMQLLGMLAFSTVQYHRYALTQDFATYSQAWWAIGHGHLDPYSAGLGVPFWRNNAEFAMWPLSVLCAVYPHPVVLLWVQDVVVVASELVALGWILEIIGRRRDRVSPRAARFVAVGAVVALVADPWVYETIAFDFHFEALAALFALLVARDLWAGRTRRLWCWVPLALLSSALGATYLVGVGISGILAGRRTRRPASAVAGLGLAWLVVLGAVGAVGGGGTALRSSYGYLDPSLRGRLGFVDIVLGMLGHPGAVAHMVALHWTVVFGFLVVVGTIGVLSPWGVGMAAVVLVPNVLDASGVFIRGAASFQSWPALPFVLVGTVMVLVRLLEGGALARRLAAVAAGVWAPVAAVIVLVVVPAVPRDWLTVDPSAAAELAHVQGAIAPGAEVVVSQGVSGRFGARGSIYALVRLDQTLPVVRHQVVFVLTTQGTDDALPGLGDAVAAAFVRDHLHARTIASGSGVQAFAWDPPPGTTSVTVP